MRLLAVTSLLLSWILLTPVAAATPRTILCLGDSLTEGYGVAKAEAYPALVASELGRRGYKDVTVVNAGISGSTSASGPARLKWQLKSGTAPTVLLLELGANDGLRGLDLGALRKNLTDTIALAHGAGVAKILLVGMLIPPSMGKAYADGFAKVFPEVAKAEHVALLPFLLAGVAADPKLNQPDGLHPTAAGHRIVARTVTDALVPLLGPPDKS